MYVFCVLVPLVGFVNIPILGLTNLCVMWGTTCILVVFYVLICRSTKRSRQLVKDTGGRVSK